MNKRAQFFIISALIIATVTISLGTVYNKAKTNEKEDIRVYELTEELHSEIQQAYDNGILAGQNQEDIEKNLKNLASHYSRQNPDSNFVIFYGDSNNLKALYTDSQGNPRISTLNPPSSLAAGSTDRVRLCLNFEAQPQISYSSQIPASTQKTCDIEREFTLQKEQTFYVAVRKKVKNEEIVISR